jgi:flagellum-specific peptidoglycan hydrolase FlgJ
MATSINTTSGSTVDVFPVSAPLTDNTNPLRQFRSYSYQFFMIACDSTEMLDWLTTASNSAFERQNPNTDPRALITVEGVGQYVIIIDTRHDVDFILDDVQWGTTFVGPTNSSNSTTSLNTVMTDGTLQIIEPRGVNFLNVLATLGDQLNVDMICMPYMLKVNFFGHMEDGSVVGLPPVAPFGFIPVDITGSVDERGTTYKMDICGIVNGIGYNPSYISVIDNASFTVHAVDLKTLLGEFAHSMNEAYNAQRDQVIDQYKLAGTDLSGAAKIVYKLELDPTWDVLGNLTDFGSNHPEQLTIEGTTHVIKGTKEGGMAEVINKLLMSSQRWVEVAAEGNPPDASNVDSTNKRYTFKVTPTFSKTSVNGSNTITITNTVSEYKYETYDVASSFGNQTQEPAPKINPNQVITFDYIFTGRNVDIIHMDLSLSMGLALLQTLATAKALSSQSKDTTGSQPANPTATPSASRSAGGFNKLGKIRKGTPIFAPIQWANDRMKEMNAIQNTATADAVWRSFAGYQSVSTQITIHGNPILLGKLVNPDRNVPNYCQINIKMPTTPDDIWEYQQGSNATPGGYYQDFWFNGYYLMLSATNKFNAGQFTQELDLVSLPQVDNTQGKVSSSSQQQDQVNAPREFMMPTQAQATPTATSTPTGDVTPAQTPTGSVGTASTPTSFVPGNANSFVATYWNSALQASQINGLNPDFLLAQAALETGYGSNTLTTYGNFFSQKAFGNPTQYWTGAITNTPMTTGASYRAYSDSSDGFSDQVVTLMRNYPTSANATDINTYANGLVNGVGGRKFTQDPNYPSEVISTYNSLQVHKSNVGIADNTYLGNPPTISPVQQGSYLAQVLAPVNTSATSNIIPQGYATSRTVGQASIDQKTPIGSS